MCFIVLQVLVVSVIQMLGIFQGEVERELKEDGGNQSLAIYSIYIQDEGVKYVGLGKKKGK